VTSRALLVLDMFSDLVGEDGPSAGSGYPEQVATRAVVDRVGQAVAAARAAGDLVVWVAVAFEPEYMDCPPGSPLFGQAPVSGGFRKNTPGTAPLAALHPAADEPVLIKPRVSPFYGTRLESLLRTAGVTEVVLTGVATEHVVLATARDGHDRDLHVTVLTDAVASSTPELHAAGLAVMASYTHQLSTGAYAALGAAA
jgi:nicotinamidase-related amidase